MSARVWGDLEFSGFAEAIARQWLLIHQSPALAAHRECAALPRLDSQQPCERSEHELPYPPLFVLPRVWLLKPMSNTTGASPMPADNGFGSDQDEGTFPSGPATLQDNPEQLVQDTRSTPSPFCLQLPDLRPQSNIFKVKVF